MTNLMENTFKYLLFILLGIYNMQGPFFESGSMITQLSLLVILLICLYYFLIVILEDGTPLFIKASFSFVFIVMLYGLIAPQFYYASENVVDMETLMLPKGTCMVFLPIAPFYYWTKKDLLVDKEMFSLILILFFNSFFLFFHTQTQLTEMLNKNNGDVTNNVSYVILSFYSVLFAFLGNKKIIFTIISAAIFCFVFWGAKRGAILTLLVLFFLNLSYLFKKRDNFLKNIIYILFLFTLFYLFISTYYMDSYLFLRIQESFDGGSELRSVMYANLWSYFVDQQSYMSILFGSGIGHSIQISGNWAHNDWLELLIDMGLFGVSLYIIILVGFIKMLLSLKNLSIEYHFSLWMIFISWLLISFYSMFFWNGSNFIYMIFIGYAFAKNEKSQMNIDK